MTSITKTSNPRQGINKSNPFQIKASNWHTWLEMAPGQGPPYSTTTLKELILLIFMTHKL